MPLPDVTLKVLDGQLGLVPASIADIQVKVGVCSDGLVGSIYSANDNGSAQSQMGQGPLVEAMSHSLSEPNAGGPCLGMPINPSSAGAASAVTRVIAVGAGVLTVTLAPKQSIAIKITTGGANGTGTFAISLGGGSYGANVATIAGAFPYAVPGTLTTITLAAATTWVLNDIYTIATDGTVTLTGSGPAATNVTHADSPLDAYAALVTIKTTGAAGAGTFTTSVDNGKTPSGEILIPSGGKYAIPNTGVVLNFSGTFTAGDTYTFTTSTAGFSNSDITTALTTLNNSASEFAWVHIVGMGASAAAAAATCAVIQTAMAAAFTGFRYIFAVMECPTNGSGASTEADSVVAAAFSATSAERVSVCAGDALMVSPITGQSVRRNIAWKYTARLAAVRAGRSPAVPGDGALVGVEKLYRDEQVTPLLDAARFTTARSFPGEAGYFITNGKMMAPAGSDFSDVERRRVMDIACRIVRKGLFPYINADVDAEDTGFIKETDALAIEKEINGKLRDGIVAQKNAVASTVRLSRDQNILSTETEPVEVRIQPRPKMKYIKVNMGFTNPARAA